MNYSMFKKPSRYIGNEINIIRKEANVKVALCFPDSYEIGMSHIGLKTLYSIINNIHDASAERVYAPWVDYESYLRNNNLLLTSLEYERPLKDFDIIGFTLQYELSYTNILNMLDLGGMPVRSEDRGNDSPLVIAGGPCTVNPLSLVSFIDAFVIGDGEEVIKEILTVYSGIKGNGSGLRNNKDTLIAISKIEGVFVPSIHDINKVTIKRRFIENLDNAPYPDSPLLPYTSIVHDRTAIEISRGCTRGCRFCQAGMTYRPARERSLENILSLAQKSIANTGYEEISFTSLSTGDYSNLLPLIRNFNNSCAGSPVSISLPSLRVGSISSDLLKEIKSVRKTGFTIAPEAGTKRLRDTINKDITDEEYDETLEKLFKEGWRNVKLYFMIGLPTETKTDIDGLIEMAVRALKKGRKITGRKVNVNVGISAFVPKTHTPFQWVGQNPVSELREKQDYIKRAFRKKGINFKGQHVEHSLLEAVFSRADKDISVLLENAWKLGSRFDGWTEHFNNDNWLAAAEKSGINLYEYATRCYDPSEKLPWDFIDTGINKKFLIQEYNRALQQEVTPDCKNICHACGLECKDLNNDEQGPQTGEVSSDNRKSTIKSSPVKMRVKFSKTGTMRYLSHQELMTSILRAMRRAGIHLTYSTGFHPHPKISFGPALAVGVEGVSEYFDMELIDFKSPSDTLKKLNSALPAGIMALSATLIHSNEKALNNLISTYEYEIVIDREDDKKINSLLNSKCHEVLRNGKTVNIRPMVIKAVIIDNKLFLTLADTDNIKVRLFEILSEMFQKSHEDLQSLRIKRIGLYGYNRCEQLEANKG